MRKLLLSVRPDETRLAVVEDGALVDYCAELARREDLVGRVYKGVVRNAVPAVKGFFVDLGVGRNAFLRSSDWPAERLPTEGASVLVQVVKDSTPTKGPLVTGKVSLPGRYSVLLTDSTYIGVSKKIRSEEKREMLRRAARAHCPEGMGLIVRTAADDAPEEEAVQDIQRLAALWAVIGRRFRVEKGPALLYRGSELAIRAIRDFLTDDTDAVITDSRDTQNRLSRLMEEEHLPRPKRVRCEAGPIFRTHHVEEQIDRLFAREVPLPSGGSLVIDYTEALTAVDVNSGSFHRKGISHSEAAFLVNREAAVEIARQIRMRGIGGMILIDFIDMDTKEQKEAVLAVLRRETAKDRVKTVVVGMTALGLVEMTRKRTAHRLLQNYYETCPACGGTGYILSAASVVLRIHHALEEEKARGGMPCPLLIECHPDAADLLEAPEEMWYLKNMMLRPVRVARRPEFRREAFAILADPGGMQ